MWSIMGFCYMEFQDSLACIQAKFSMEWERSYMEKALKEDERRRAQHIFADVQTMLGNRELICITIVPEMEMIIGMYTACTLLVIFTPGNTTKLARMNVETTLPPESLVLLYI